MVLGLLFSNLKLIRLLMQVLCHNIDLEQISDENEFTSRQSISHHIRKSPQTDRKRNFQAKFCNTASRFHHLANRLTLSIYLSSKRLTRLA